MLDKLNLILEKDRSETNFVRYCKFIRQRIVRDSPAEGENHHILPKSLGKKYLGMTDKDLNDSSNLIRLTHREHFIAHLILWKAFPGKEMSYAFHRLAFDKEKGRGVLSSRQFCVLMSELRKSYEGESNPFFGKHHSEETRKTIRNFLLSDKNSCRGRKRTPDQLAKLREAHVGQVVTKETIAKRIETKLQNGTNVPTEETKRKISDSLAGKTLSEETREKIRRAQTGKTHTEETKAKISMSNKGVAKHTDDSKKRISDSRKGKKASEETRVKIRESVLERSEENRIALKKRWEDPVWRKATKEKMRKAHGGPK